MSFLVGGVLELVSSARVGFCIGSLVETGVLLGLGKGVEVESGMVFLLRTVSDILISWFFREVDGARLDGFPLSAGQLDVTFFMPPRVIGSSPNLLSSCCRALQITGADEPLLASLLRSLERFDRAEEPVELDFLGSLSFERPREQLVEVLDTILPLCSWKLSPLGTDTRHLGVECASVEGFILLKVTNGRSLRLLEIPTTENQK